MGVVYIEGVATGPAGKQETVRFLVDSGATYTLLPEKAWRAIGLSPKRTPFSPRTTHPRSPLSKLREGARSEGPDFELTLPTSLS
ncbi:MAG: aspartyl protease family protein [Bacillota bacterium]